jgi:YD repeat-containing protein
VQAHGDHAALTCTRIIYSTVSGFGCKRCNGIAEKRITETKDDQTTTKVYQYTYDSANRMITETENGGDSRTYRYDPNGNRLLGCWMEVVV